MIAIRSSTGLLQSVKHSASASSRGLHYSIRSLQQVDSSPSSPVPRPQMNVAAQLRKRLEQQRARPSGPRKEQGSAPRRDQAGVPRREQGGFSGRRQDGVRARKDDANARGGRPPRRDGNRSDTSSSRPTQQRRDGPNNRRAQRMTRRPRDSEIEVLPPAPIQNIQPATKWQQAASSAAPGYNRVPYATPRITLEALREKSASDASKFRPLRRSSRSLRLNSLGAGLYSVRGPIQDPMMPARARSKADDAPAYPSSREEGRSLAEVAKDGRMRVIKERFGGDYHRWERSALDSQIKADSSHHIQLQAAEALTLNDDLGPSNKAWTLSTVGKIVG